MTAQILGIALSVLVVLVVVRLVVRRRLLVKYAALWLMVSLALFVLGAIPAVLDAASQALGFEVPSNFLFFAGFGLILLVTLQLSVELTKVEARVQRLAEEHAIAQRTSSPAEGLGTPEAP